MWIRHPIRRGLPFSREREKEGPAAKLWEDEGLVLLCCAAALNKKKTLTLPSPASGRG